MSSKPDRAAHGPTRVICVTSLVSARTEPDAVTRTTGTCDLAHKENWHPEALARRMVSRHTMAAEECMPIASNEDNVQPNAGALPVSQEDRQRRRMLIALALLLIALIVVLIKDRQFWFSSNTPPETAPATEELSSPPAATPQAAPTVATTQPPVTSTASTKAKSKKRSAKAPAPHVAAAPEAAEPQPSGPVITATNRTVLPPLEVEVVAGSSHRPLSPNNSSVKVDMDSNSSAVPSPTPAVPVPEEKAAPQAADTSARVTVPPATAERVSRSVKPTYPVLAKQMKVQGAVVLQALIDRTGNIQELHVVTGPAILATAAEEAVKQWHFKPYYQQGQPVETEARITVNFTISTY
jgi:periplasmic protein TonB